MGSSKRDNRARNARESERYRKAAELAIEQLDWCIDYFQKIRKGSIAKALQKNRNWIARRL
jgi:hypothetical protein